MTVDVQGSESRPRRAWWPIAALAVLLLVLAATMVTSAGISPLSPEPKAAYLDSQPRLEAMDGITAPTPSVSPDPATYIQQIKIILPPPPPPPAAKSGGKRSGGSGGSGGGGGGVALNKADAGAFCAGINAERQGVGLPALSSCYATSARQSHANAMAATSPVSIWHSGDNIVGVAPSMSRLMKAFMDSPGHNAQIVTPSYTTAKVGCAWGQASNVSSPHIYCTADFS